VAAKSKLEQILLSNRPAPILPTGLNRLLQAFEAHSLTPKDLVEVISEYPAIAARLLFVANSAWAPPSVPIESLEAACIRLGVTLVRSVSISLCITASFDVISRCPAFEPERFWCTALMAAEASALLADMCVGIDVPDNATMYTAGLLHNLGLLWLAGNWSEETSRALQLKSERDDISVRAALREVVGIDYCEAGGVLGRAWKLPQVLVSAIEYHSAEDYPNCAEPSAVLVGYALELMDALNSESEQSPSLRERGGIALDHQRLDEVLQRLREKRQEISRLSSVIFS